MNGYSPYNYFNGQSNGSGMLGGQQGQSMSAGLGGGLTSLLSGLFGGSGQSNPASAANPYFQQIMQMLPGYFQPWQQAGQNALPQLSSQFGNMAANPGQDMAQIGAGYTQSPGYQFQLQQGLNGANSAAAAGGMGGTPMAQYNAGQFATGLANQDYYNYLNHALGIQGQGLQGLQGLSQQGLGASQGLGEDLAQALMSQANLAYAGQQNQNQQQGGDMGSLIGGIGSLVSSFF